MDSSERSVKSEDLNDMDDVSDDEGDEELDPRIKQELEKLNAATDGINHLETEFGEAQALFQQMMQDATTQLRHTHHVLGKCVDKSRPYFEALVQAKLSHNQLHDAALSFEQAQTRHFNAKKLVHEAERKALSTGKLNPALQEYLNQVTIEVMEAATLSQQAWEKHRQASAEFEKKQKIMHDYLKSLNKHITKARPYFDLKFNLNKQLEFQKRRLEKIQEGLQVSKNAYSETLRNLEVISDDIHRTRELKRKALLEPRGQGVGADSDTDECSIPHDSTMKRINALTLDNISDSLSFAETGSTISETSFNELNSSDILERDLAHLDTDALSPQNKNKDYKDSKEHDSSNNLSGAVVRLKSEELIKKEDDKTPSSPILESEDARVEPIPETPLKFSPSTTTTDIVKTLEQKVRDIDISYAIITSHSVPQSPPPTDNILFDFTDNEGRKSKRHSSLGDLFKNKEESEWRRRTQNGTALKKRWSMFF